MPDRGKHREILAVNFAERVVQKCLCDYWLIPLLKPRLIYDSGATLIHKGQKFMMDRLKAHLQKYYRQNGNSNNGYVLLLDFHHYFQSIDQNILLNKVHKLSNDEKLFNLYAYFINNFGKVGLGLGSQVSQISALFYISSLDHYIKEKLHCKYYGRYMDDSYIIIKDKYKAQEILNEIIEFIKPLNIELNEHKSRISKVSNFIILRKHWSLKSNGYVFIKPIYKTLLRLKRKWKVVKIKDINSIKQFKASVYGTLKYYKIRRLYSYVYS